MKLVRFVAPALLLLGLVVGPAQHAGALDLLGVSGSVSTWSDFHACATVNFGSGTLVGTFTAIGAVTSGGTTSSVHEVVPILTSVGPWSYCSGAAFANPVAGDVTFILEASTVNGSVVVVRNCSKTLLTPFTCTTS